ncbi:MAG: glycosyl hydrolase family 28 protein [Myxococcota bacterium]|nr:glycosyl hydrolase family 28 protein [Myxococcota bacterium]
MTPFAAPDNSLTFTPPTIPCTIFSISSYGAKTGSTAAANRTAINNAVAAAKAAGGGVVDVPAGTWPSGAIQLDSNIELHLDAGATIAFSASAADYLPAVLTRWEGLDVMNYSPLVYALNATNVAITGTGTLKGPGPAWGGGIGNWKTASMTVAANIYQMYYTALPKGMGTLPPPPNAVQPNGAPGLRPTFVECNGCTNFLVDGPTVTAGPYWTLHPLYSDNVIVRNVKVDTSANGTGSNGDGTNPDSCSNVLIDGATYATSDDNIAIKAGLNEDGIAVGKPSHNIVVRNVQSTTGHGGITIGSEMSGGVNNVYATASKFMGVQDSIRIKTLNGRGGVLENFWFENLTLGWSKDGINLTTQYSQSTIAPHDPSLVTTLRNINITGVTGTGSGPVYSITGPASNISLNMINLSGGAGTCTAATMITLTNVMFNGSAATTLSGC